MRAVRIVGAPASGKTTLRRALARELELPSYAIDDERLAIMEPGEVWPRDDTRAWMRLRDRIEAGPCIVETSGNSPRDVWLFAGVERFTILCWADYFTRRGRLVGRVRSGHPLARTPHYVQRLTQQGDPVGLHIDAVWQGEALASLVASVRTWLAPVAV